MAIHEHERLGSYFVVRFNGALKIKSDSLIMPCKLACHAKLYARLIRLFSRVSMSLGSARC